MSDMRGIMVTIMVFSALLSGTLFFSTAVMDATGQSVDDEALQSLSEDMNERSESTEGALESQTREIDSGLEAGLFYLRSAFDVLLILLDLFVAIPSIAATFIIELNLPTWAKLLGSIPFAYGLVTLVYEARRN